MGGDICYEVVERYPSLYAVCHRQTADGVEYSAGVLEAAVTKRFRKEGTLGGRPEAGPELAGGGKVARREEEGGVCFRQGAGRAVGERANGVRDADGGRDPCAGEGAACSENVVLGPVALTEWASS
jgi:hypothetical protein